MRGPRRPPDSLGGPLPRVTTSVSTSAEFVVQTCLLRFGRYLELPRIRVLGFAVDRLDRPVRVLDQIVLLHDCRQHTLRLRVVRVLDADGRRRRPSVRSRHDVKFGAEDASRGRIDPELPGCGFATADTDERPPHATADPHLLSTTTRRPLRLAL